MNNNLIRLKVFFRTMTHMGFRVLWCDNTLYLKHRGDLVGFTNADHLRTWLEAHRGEGIKA